jgi:hypothetical protein
MAVCCDLETCERALQEYLSRFAIREKLHPGPQLVHYETQAGELPIKLSFAIKVF